MDEKNVNDPIAIIKTCINLAITSSYLDEPLMKNTFFRKAEPHIKQSSSEWRYYMLTNKKGTRSINKPKAQYQQVLDFDPWFLIYAHD